MKKKYSSHRDNRMVSNMHVVSDTISGIQLTSEPTEQDNVSTNIWNIIAQFNTIPGWRYALCASHAITQQFGCTFMHNIPCYIQHFRTQHATVMWTFSIVWLTNTQAYMFATNNPIGIYMHHGGTYVCSHTNQIAGNIIQETCIVIVNVPTYIDIDWNTGLITGNSWSI